MNEYELGVSIVEAGTVPQVPRFDAGTKKTDVHLRAMPGNEKKFPPERYNQIVYEVFAQVNKLSNLKGDEYAAGADRLANFRKMSKKYNTPMELIWAVYAGKHIDALDQYVNDIKDGTKRERMEPPSSRVLDIIVYLTLMLCMMEERDGSHVKID